MTGKMENISISAIAADVMKCAEEISARLGYKKSSL
jgi:hypothetical protein